ncbi:hypothetical protein M011DRAFT_461989 [Sporormia fimetaria CBS 119925]|uniref:F-box domain-containing protein n=1 Tax=Sporormia fimetaria CBS 119925 TaxID=1340428 RepID=A0A6A6UXL9_9PLEO|nr:hypothetical protein M011DRAFT_461989 [Sporormia fimetaria CBS 119925]
MTTPSLSPLENLSLELQHQIRDDLPLDDFLSFRQASHTCERIAERRFTEIATELFRGGGQLIVFHTDTGVRLLLGLLRIPAILPLIKRISVVSARQFIQRLRGVHQELLDFELSVECKTLWMEVLGILKNSTVFQKIFIGYSSRWGSTEHALGSKEIARMWYGPHTDDGSPGLDILEGLIFPRLFSTMTGMMTAIAETDFDLSKVVVIKVSPAWSPRYSAYFDHVEVPLWDGWQPVAQNCIQEVHVSNLDLSSGTGGHTIPIEDRVFMTECFHLAIGMNTLAVDGSWGRTWHHIAQNTQEQCGDCTGLIRCLNTYSYDALRKVRLSTLMIDERTLVSLFSSSIPHLWNITLSYICLCRGSWAPVFQAMQNLPSIGILSILWLGYAQNPVGHETGLTSVQTSVNGRERCHSWFGFIRRRRNSRTALVRLFNGIRIRLCFRLLRPVIPS